MIREDFKESGQIIQQVLCPVLHDASGFSLKITPVTAYSIPDPKIPEHVQYRAHNLYW